MKRDVVIEPAQVTALREAVSAALEAGAGNPAMVMTYGEAGTGKTIAAKLLYVELGGYYLRAMEGMSQAAFLQDLCFEVDGSRPHGSAKNKQTLLKRLTDYPAPIFIDEADRLHVSRLEDLRDIHDITGAPIILVGEMGLPTKVSARTRINDRIPASFRVNFGAISRTDIMIYATKVAEITLSPEAGSVVYEATKGNFRRVYNTMLSLANATKASGKTEVSAEMARAVLASAKKR